MVAYRAREEVEVAIGLHLHGVEAAHAFPTNIVAAAARGDRSAVCQRIGIK